MGNAKRIHADDTTVPVLAKGKTRTGRLWTYVRDDRPFAGTAAPAAAFFYSADRGGVHPDAHLAGYAGLMQADAYAGFNRFYQAGRKPGPIIEAMCWAHARRKFFDLARLSKAPIAIVAAGRWDGTRAAAGKPCSWRNVLLCLDGAQLHLPLGRFSCARFRFRFCCLLPPFLARPRWHPLSRHTPILGAPEPTKWIVTQHPAITPATSSA
jgi:hypothetical protein